ncbi:formyltransferase family protein, partial [Campylobacter volucris]|uniref:formyltransferase family protein n=1 Tax=Campylobacter volucris TaxID=1031542 RepID=UPI00226CD9E4
MNIILVGTTTNFDIFNSILQNKHIKVIGAIIDKNSTSNIEYKLHLNFIKKHNIKEIQLEELPIIKYDLCLIITYSKILDIKYFKNGININIHGGILPYWRGFYANIWAVLNNQSYIGYTLHALNKNMDDGDIYYVIKERIYKNEKFYNANERLRKKTCD